MRMSVQRKRKGRTIGQRIFGGYVVVVLFAILIAGAGLYMLRSVDGAYRKFIDSDEAILKTALQLRVAIMQQGEAYRGFLLYGDLEDRAPWEQGNEEFKRAIGKLKEILQDESDRAVLEEAMVAANLLYQAQRESVRIRDTGDSAQALRASRGVVLEFRDALLNHVTELERRQRLHLQLERQALARRVKTIAWSMLLLSSTALLVSLLTAAVLSRSISQQLRSAVAQIMSSTSEVSTMTSQMVASAAKTAGAVSETTATVSEVKQTVRVSSDAATRVSESAKEAASIAQTGKNAVEVTAHETALARAQMETISNCVLQLSDQGREITEIIATVTELAERSNLLSVNTAIEAARAGEQGVGFRVVAEEVKQLAAQSKQATMQVRQILGETQRAVGAAVMAVEQGSKAVAKVEREALDAGASIRSLADIVAQAAHASAQIEASIKQQVVGLDQCAQAMMSIDQESSLNMVGARQSEQAMQDLTGLAERIRDMFERA